MDNRFPERIPEWVAIEIYRNRESSESALTFIEYVRKKNWILDCKPQEQTVSHVAK
jgi:hypothetical protein